MYKLERSCEYVKRWRLKTRQRMAAAFGGKCCCCGYNRCMRALEFHHLNPCEKDFTFGAFLAHAVAWDKVVTELQKCVMVCSNCHREIHDGIMVVPDDAPRFNEVFVDYREDEFFDKCPICGNKKRKYQKTCSYSCAARKSWKVKWPDDLDKLVASSSKRAVAEQLGVSDHAVAKRLRNHF